MLLREDPLLSGASSLASHSAVARTNATFPKDPMNVRLSKKAAEVLGIED